MNISTAIQDATQRLVSHNESGRLDVEVLIANLLHKPRAWVLAHPEVKLEPDQIVILENGLAQLERGIPLPYVIGSWEFYGLRFKVDNTVLIPRPETELLVEHALEWLKAREHPCLGLDVGTGSGCIAVSLALFKSELHWIACDISLPALSVARHNAQTHQVDQRIKLIQSDLIPSITRPFDLICANLPYIPTSVLQQLLVFKSEPTLALDGGANGLQYINRLFESAPAYLNPGGMLLCEIEARQGSLALNLAKKNFPNAIISLHQDLAGLDRLVKIIW